MEFPSLRIRDYGTSFICRPVLAFLLLGLVVRAVVGILMTYTFDVHSWALIIANFESGNGLYGLDGYYYAPPWGYFLGPVAVVSEALGVDLFGDRFTDVLPIESYEWHFLANVPTVAFAMSVKALYFVCDIIVGYIIYRIVADRTGDQRKAVLGFGLWFLCPFVITVAAAGGMFDTIPVMFALLCVYFVMKDRCLLAGMTFSVAVLLKMFPAFLIFILVGYILMKHRDDGRAVRLLTEAVVGAGAMALVLMLPQILQGDLADCFSFLTNRATGVSGSGYTDVTGKLMILVYVAFAMVAVFLGHRMYRSTARDIDGHLLSMCFLMTIVVFLYPSTPQYMLLLAPFLIIHTVAADRRFLRPLLVLMVGTTMFSIAGNATLLLSVAEYTDLISQDAVMAAIEWFQASTALGLSPMEFVYYGGGILQYVGTAYAMAMYIRTRPDRIMSGGASAPEAPGL